MIIAPATLLINATYSLLASIPRRFRLTDLQVKAKVGRRSIAGRFHAQFLSLTHREVFDCSILGHDNLLLLVVLLTRRLRLVVRLVHCSALGVARVADEVAAVERYLVFGGRLLHHIQL